MTLRRLIGALFRYFLHKIKRTHRAEVPPEDFSRSDMNRGAAMLTMLEDRGFDLDVLAGVPAFSALLRGFHEKKRSATEVLRICEKLNAFNGGSLKAPPPR